MKSVKMTKIRKQSCPACHAPLNAASHVSGDFTPEPGDVSLCMFCNAVLVFGEAMDLRFATQTEITAFEKELDILADRLKKKTYSLLNTPHGMAILCHQCGMSSSNPHDVENRYCGHCQQFL